MLISSFFSFRLENRRRFTPTGFSKQVWSWRLWRNVWFSMLHWTLSSCPSFSCPQGMLQLCDLQPPRWLSFIVLQYHDNPEQALIANANIGGENCHRGAALAALLGAGSSTTEGFWPSRWMHGLHDKRAIDIEIQSFLSSCQRSEGEKKSDL